MWLAPRLSLFYGAIFIVIGIQLPFWPVWLAARGLEPEAIGILLAAPPWIKTIATPVAGMVADRTGNRRGTILVLALIGLGVTTAYAAVDGFWRLLAVTLVSAACFGSIMPL